MRDMKNILLVAYWLLAGFGAFSQAVRKLHQKRS